MRILNRLLLGVWLVTAHAIAAELSFEKLQTRGFDFKKDDNGRVDRTILVIKGKKLSDLLKRIEVHRKEFEIAKGANPSEKPTEVALKHGLVFVLRPTNSFRDSHRLYDLTVSKAPATKRPPKEPVPNERHPKPASGNDADHRRNKEAEQVVGPDARDAPE